MTSMTSRTSVTSMTSRTSVTSAAWSVLGALAAGTVAGLLLAAPLADRSTRADAPGMGAVAAMGGLSGWNGGFEQGQLSPEQMDRIMAVAHDLSPQLETQLASARQADADAFRAALGEQGKRLGALAILRDRRPELYAIRIDELKLEASAMDLGRQLQSAATDGRTEEVARLEPALRSTVLKCVDANLRARAVELSSLDTMMREFRTTLERDALDRTETVQRWVDALREGRPPEPLGGRRPTGVLAGTTPSK